MSDHLQVWDARNNLLFFVYTLELRGTIHSDNFHVNLVVYEWSLKDGLTEINLTCPL